MEDKKSLTSPEERAVIEGKASLSAAVDYYVSMQSEIFISASPGNMHNALVRLRLSDFKFYSERTDILPTFRRGWLFWLSCKL